MRRSLNELSRPESVDLLAGASIGRVGVTIGALPVILPVNYGLLDDAIVFRTAPGTKLTAALQETVVAFEVDCADAHASTGWSVLVIGKASEIRDAAMLKRARALGLRPWAPGSRDHFVEIRLEMVSGRRIVAPPGDLHAD